MIMKRPTKILLVSLLSLLMACSKNLDAELSKAASDGDSAKVKTLIAQGADVNSKNGVCMTPLMLAVLNNDSETVSTLMRAHADENIKDCAGETAMSYAVKNHHSDVLALLIRKGEPLIEKYSPPPPPNAVGTHQELDNKLHELAFRMDYSDDPAVVDRDEDANAATALVQAGADVNSRDDKTATPLMRAAFMGHIKVMKVLIDSGADVNLQDESGQTALMYAANAPDEKAVSLLLAHGTKPNIKDKYGETALSGIKMQTTQEYLPVKRVLKKAGAK